MPTFLETASKSRSPALAVVVLEALPFLKQRLKATRWRCRTRVREEEHGMERHVTWAREPASRDRARKLLSRQLKNHG